MALWLRQSTTVNVKLGPAVSQSDAVTEKTALSPTVNLTKNAGTIAARNSATAIAHDANGWYTVELNTTDTGTLGRLQVYFRDPTSQLPVWADFMVVPAMVYDSLIAGSDYLDASVVQWTGTNVASPATAGYPAVTIKSGSGTGEVDLSSGKVLLQATQTGVTIPTVTTLTGHTPQTGDAYARLGAPAGASVSADVAAIKTDTGNLVTRITSTLFSGITSLKEWLGLLAGKQTGNSTARTELRSTGAGSGTYDETTDSLEANRDNQMTSGELENAVLDAALSGHTTAGTAGKALSDAASAASVPSAATVAAAVWDKALASHTTAGTAGERLGRIPNAAAGANGGLPTVNASNYIAGIQGTLNTLDALDTAQDAQHATTQGYLDTEIASIISSLTTIAGYLDTEIAAIKAKTDNLPADPADASDVAAAIAGLNNIAASDVLAQVNAALNTAISELSAVPSATPTIRTALMFLFMNLRNRTTTTATAETIQNDAGTTIATAALSDDGTTFTKGEFA